MKVSEYTILAAFSIFFLLPIGVQAFGLDIGCEGTFCEGVFSGVVLLFFAGPLFFVLALMTLGVFRTLRRRGISKPGLLWVILLLEALLVSAVVYFWLFSSSY